MSKLKFYFIIGFILLLLLNFRHIIQFLGINSKKELMTKDNHPILMKDLKIDKIIEPTIITLENFLNHENTLHLLGSLHAIHENFRFVIYGLNLNKEQRSEIRLWKNVDFYDIREIFVMFSDEDDDQSNLENWKPIVIRHALERYRSILFIDNSFIIKQPLVDIFKIINKNGSFLISDNSNIGCNSDIQGFYTDLFLNLLNLEIKCMNKKRKCSNLEIEKIYQFYSKFCKFKLPNHIFKKHNLQSELKCHIKMRDDIILSKYQLPFMGTKNTKKEIDKIYIGIGFPSTSKGITTKHSSELLLFKVFLPSFIKSIDPIGKYFYRYVNLFLKNNSIFRLYLVYDEGDLYYDNMDNQNEMMNVIGEIINGSPITFKMIKAIPSHGNVVYLWNIAFQHAMDDDCDYFYQVNDDLEFITPNWTEKLILPLKENKNYPNLGVTGPLDLGNGKILTQSFVHKTHYDIFGFYYPPIFKNWYSDDWLTLVYQNDTIRVSDVKVFNQQILGTRYSACRNPINFEKTLNFGIREIQKWKMKFNGGYF